MYGLSQTTDCIAVLPNCSQLPHRDDQTGSRRRRAEVDKPSFRSRDNCPSTVFPKFADRTGQISCLCSYRRSLAPGITPDLPVRRLNHWDDRGYHLRPDQFVDLPRRASARENRLPVSVSVVEREKCQLARVLPRKVRIPPQFSGHFVRYRHPMPDSHKTHGNSVHWIVCRNTCGFPMPSRASFVGRFVAFPKND